jgi:hypothetical protein
VVYHLPHEGTLSGAADADERKDVRKINMLLDVVQDQPGDAFRINGAIPMGVLIDKDGFKHDSHSDYFVN